MLAWARTTIDPLPSRPLGGDFAPEVRGLRACASHDLALWCTVGNSCHVRQMRLAQRARQYVLFQRE